MGGGGARPGWRRVGILTGGMSPERDGVGRSGRGDYRQKTNQERRAHNNTSGTSKQRKKMRERTANRECVSKKE